MVSMRSCIACRSRESSKELLHLVLVQGRVTPDPGHKLQGRGAWLHSNCFELALLRRSFNRAFKSGEDLLTHDLEVFLKSSF
jgi:predicted RNA-binding protein YlxR (DUF448 family)